MHVFFVSDVFFLCKGPPFPPKLENTLFAMQSAPIVLHLFRKPILFYAEVPYFPHLFRIHILFYAEVPYFSHLFRKCILFYAEVPYFLHL